MTRYILAGGCDRLYPEYLTQLARTIHLDYDKPSILSCWFSNKDEDATSKFPEYKEFFLQFFNQGSSFINADKVTFLSQVENADVIYFHGGHTSLLLAAMQQYGDMHAAFKNKIVVGSSAGANYISKVGFSPRSGSAEYGSGLLNVSLIVHYGSRGFDESTFEPPFWNEAIQKVRQKAGNKEIILLPEGTFSVIDA